MQTAHLFATLHCWQFKVEGHRTQPTLLVEVQVYPDGQHPGAYDGVLKYPLLH